MSAAATTQVAQLPPVPAGADPTSQLGRLLRLVRKLVDYGKQLATSLQQRTADLAAVKLGFGTADIALILATITRGLQRANALEARLLQRADRPDPKPAPEHAPTARKPRAARAAPRRAAADDRLAGLPTPEQIAQAVRRQPIGVVIADICRDLGIVPTHPLWLEISLVVIDYGGSLVRLLETAFDRALPQTAPAARRLAAASLGPTPAATGPP